MNITGNAAYALVGLVLNNKWKVTSLISKPAFGTGGHFSVCYEVTDGEQIAFLKAINFAALFNRPVKDINAVINL